MKKYVPTIGIECHVQLKTTTKLFSAASNDDADASPNKTVSPICFGLPGTLPVLNEKAVELAVRAGIAMNCEIAKVSSFDRKHYFYPDLPKGYQITQLDRPTVGKGEITIHLPSGESKKVRITRAHMEEDAGKLTHPSGADYSLVDLNRAGTPLIEIVSESDMHSAEEAKAYVQELYLLMKYANVTHGNLQNGNMRFDVNISIAEEGATKLGTRAEIKNLNSFRAVEKAVEYEIKRQSELLDKGEKIKQETRGWDDAKQKTLSQRSKEEAQDYRYFPEADIPPIEIDDKYIKDVRSSMPLLPPEIREILAKLGLSRDMSETLISKSIDLGPEMLEVVLALGEIDRSSAVFAANFLLNRDYEGASEVAIPKTEHFQAVYDMKDAGELSSNNADALLIELTSKPDAAAKELAASLGFLQQNDESTLQAIIDEVLSDPASAKAVADIKAGNQKAIGFLVGQVMKKSKGQANPGIVSKLINQTINA